MARSRNIKPGFFKNEVLGEMTFAERLLFVGLWTHADREGRFEYRPRRIKAELFPYDDINIEDGIAALVDGGFLLVFELAGVKYCQVLNWSKHQNPHHKEVGSTIPGPPGHTDRVCAGYIPLSNTIRRRIYDRDGRVCRECSATHGLSIDHVIPVSKGGNSTDDNLQVLCLGCNARKGNRIFMDDSCMADACGEQNDSCPTDSLSLDSLNPPTDSPNPMAGDARPVEAVEFAELIAVYHELLPKCQRISAMTDKRKRLIRNAEKNAKRICREKGWTYGADFWRDFFTECSKDEWRRGDRPNPNNPAWRQSLDVLLRDEHFAKVMDSALGGGA